MSEGGGCGYFLTIAVLVFAGFTMGRDSIEPELKKFRTEAVERGLAKWTVDPAKGGSPVFVWVDERVEVEGTTP